MERRKIIGAAVFSAAIAGGGIAGVVLGSPTSSSAATASGAGATSPGSRPAWGTGRFGMFGHRSGLGRGFGLDAAAKAIGVSDQTLLSDLQGGKTIAQVAASKGVATKTVIDAMVAAATREFASQVKAGHLTAAQAAMIDANLTQMITNQVNGTFRHPNGPGGMGAGGGPGGFGGPFGGAPGGPFGGAPGGPAAGVGPSTPTSVAPTV